MARTGAWEAGPRELSEARTETRLLFLDPDPSVAEEDLQQWSVQQCGDKEFGGVSQDMVRDMQVLVPYAGQLNQAAEPGVQLRGSCLAKAVQSLLGLRILHRARGIKHKHTHAFRHIQTHTLICTCSHTLLPAKHKCKREILSLWNRCSRAEGICSQHLPVNKQNGVRLSTGTHTHTYSHCWRSATRPTTSEWCSGPSNLGSPKSSVSISKHLGVTFH